jgi:glucose-1-phosphate thymidylyltransferase
MKGIVLAGGTGSRMFPNTLAVTKQLLPVYDKPTIYYPMSTLMLAGIREILIISTPADLPHVQRLFGDGSQLGLEITYAEQAAPNGLAEAFIIGADHIGTDSVALVLGDNIHHGQGLSPLLRHNARSVDGCVLFGYDVTDPQNYGVAEFDEAGALAGVTEKPQFPRSNTAITGLYFYDNEVVDIAEKVQPSARGELEITSVNQEYLSRGKAKLVHLGRGFSWLDTGTPETLLMASQYVHVLQSRQSVRIACVEEVALRMGFIDKDACRRLGERMKQSAYGRYVMEIAKGQL